jgi:hypothetical protein
MIVKGFQMLRLLAHCCCKVAIGFSAMAWLDFRAVLSTTWYVHPSFNLFGDLFSISTSGIVKFDTSIMVDSHDNRCLFADTSWGKEVHISNWYHDCSCIQRCSCSTVGLITSAIYSCMLHIVQCLLAYIFCTLWYVGRMRINCYMCTATRHGKRCGYLVATPGWLSDLLERARVSLLLVHYVALDEADHKLDMRFKPQNCGANGYAIHQLVSIKKGKLGNFFSKHFVLLAKHMLQKML